MVVRLAEVISETNWIKRCDLINHELSIERDETEQLKEFAKSLGLSYKTLREHFSLYTFIKSQWPDQEINDIHCAFSAAAQLRRFHKKCFDMAPEYRRKVFQGEVPYRTVKAETDMMLKELAPATKSGNTSHQGTSARFKNYFKETIADNLIQNDHDDFTINFNQRLSLIPISVDIVCSYKSQIQAAFKIQAPNNSLPVSEEINRVGILFILKKQFDVVFQIFPEDMIQNAMNVCDYIDALDIEDVFVMINDRDLGLTLLSSKETDVITPREIILKKIAN